MSAQPQNSSSRVFLLVAVVLGVLATVITFAFLDKSTGQDRGPKASVLVAARDLKPDTPLDPDKDLKKMEVPGSFTELRLRALLPEFQTSYKGQRVNRRILAGQVVLQADLATVAELRVDPAKRAMSIMAKGASGLSGLLVPGDYVKLMVTKPDIRPQMRPATNPADPEGAPFIPLSAGAYKTEVVLAADEAVKVLAVGPRLSRARQQITAAEQYEAMREREQQETVTLEVTEAQAMRILERTGAGQFNVTLLYVPPAATMPSR